MSAHLTDSMRAQLGSQRGRTAPGSGVRVRRVVGRALWVIALAAFAIHGVHVGFGVGSASTDPIVDVWVY